MKLLYLIYQVCIAAPIILVATLLTAFFTIAGCALGDGHFWGYWPGRIWSRVICTVLLLPVRVEGHPEVEEGQSYVFVANHQGAFDIFLIYGYLGRNFKWMMKKGLRQLPFVGKACESAGHIFVDKSSRGGVRHTIEHAHRVLQGGTSLVVFPEGARTFSGHMGYFKKGAYQLADELQLPVVPLTIVGSFEILPRTGKYLHWHRLTLRVHPPVYPVGQGTENIKHLMEASYKAIESGLPRELQGMVENPDQ